MKFFMMNGKWVLQAPEEAENGDATGGPAGEEAGSEGESEFESMAESFESSSYDDEVEEGDDAASKETADDDGSAEKTNDESSEEVETERDESEADEDESKEEEETDEPEPEEEAEETSEPLTSEQIEEARNQYIDQMAEQFAVSDEEADMLRTEPEKVIPKMMARAMTQALEQSVQIMRNNLPQLVGTQLTQQSKAQEIESKFFGKYPELKDKKAIKVAEGAAKAYRQANPDATLEEVMDSVAFMTWKRLGLPMEQLSERMNGTKDEVFNKSSVTQKGKGGYAPANPGKTGAERTATREVTSEFEELANLMQNDSMFDG